METNNPMNGLDTSFLQQTNDIIPMSEVDLPDVDEDSGSSVAGGTEEALFFKKVKDRNVLKANYRLALGIDPSQNGSGFALYDNREGKNELHLMSSSLHLGDPAKDPLAFYKMQQEFREDLKSVVETAIPEGTDDVFDLIVIENTILNHSAEVFKKLVLINYMIDTLLGDGTVKTKDFVRVNNNVWKHFLYQYKPGKHYKKVKLEIEDVLLYLEEPYALENHDKPAAWKKNNQYQDKLDALSMILVGREIQQDIKEKGSKKHKLKYQYELVFTRPDTNSENGYTELQLTNRLPNTLLDSIDTLGKEAHKGKYFIEVTASQLGNFGIKNDLLFPFGESVGYLLIF